MTTLDEIFTGAGFTQDNEARSWIGEMAEAMGMNEGGPYVAHMVWSKADVHATLEQTSHPDGEMLLTYPQVLIIDFPGGRVAASPTDLELVANLVQDLA